MLSLGFQDMSLFEGLWVCRTCGSGVMRCAVPFWGSSIMAFLSRVTQFLCIKTSIWCCHIKKKKISHSDKGVAISHVVSICISLVFNDVDHLFMYLFICQLYILLSKMSIQFFCPFSNWVVWLIFESFESSLYILETSPFLDIWLVNIFFSL